MKMRAIAERGGALPASLSGGEYRAFRDMMAALSPEVGPVLRASSFLGVGESGGGSYSGHAELSDLDGIFRDIYGQPSMNPELTDTIFGGGKGLGLSGTMLSTIGEALERGVAALVGTSPYLPSKRITCSYDEMVHHGLPALDPDLLSLFSRDQYDSPSFLYVPFTRQTPVMWLQGKRLISKESVWVAAQLVDMAHIYDRGEEIVGYPVSGGLSCHTSYNNALYNGITEVIERDAINVSWYTPKSPKRVRLDTLPRSIVANFVDRLSLDHSESFLLFHENGMVTAPTLSFVGFQRWLSRRQYCAGGGCDYVTETALRKAVVEFGQTRSTLGVAIDAPGSMVGVSVEEMFDWSPGRSLAEMTLFFQAIGFYGLDENRAHLNSYLSGEEITYEDLLGRCSPLDTSSTVDERMEALVAEFGEHGIDPIALDYSHPSWSDLSIVKVYIPELSTPFLQSRPMLGHPRLQDLRPEARLGVSALPLPYP